MSKIILDQRSIINRKALVSRISSISLEKNLKDSSSQKLIHNIISEDIKSGKLEIKRRFEENQNGLNAANLNSFMIDQILRTLFEIATLHIYRATNPTKSEKLVIVAIGGYGRSEIAPFSDIDLLFLHPYKLTVWGEQVIEYILYTLWDLGFKLGYSVRTIEECIKMSKDDIVTNTSILEARYVCGNRELYKKLQEKYYKEIICNHKVDFLTLKLKERDLRYKKFGESRYLVEPNIKESKGALRDIQTIFWIGKYTNNFTNINQYLNFKIFTKNEINKYRKSEIFYWTIRFWLHYLAGRSEDRLTFDHQIEISKKLNFRKKGSTTAVERFMKKYYLTANEVGSLSRIFLSNINFSEDVNSGLSPKKMSLVLKKDSDIIREYQNKLSIIDEKVFFNKSINVIKLFAIAQSYDIDVHPKSITAIIRNLYRVPKLRGDTEANSLFLEILASKKNPEKILRKMNESGFLGRFIPEFGKIVAQTQHDMYHLYTVDEHTIRAIGIMNKIESGELNNEHNFASIIAKKINSRRVLYLAIFLHDIAKGQPGDHSKIGEKIALNLCYRLGLDEEEVKAVAWLVRWHLLMSHTAFKRDLGDMKTIQDFSKLVVNKDRLDMLFLLTISDISAVGPNTWNAWKGQLLGNLYNSANALIEGSFDKTIEERTILSIKKLEKSLKTWSNADFSNFISLHHDSYWLSTDLQSQIRQAEVVKSQNFSNNKLKIKAYIDTINAVTEIIVYSPDQPGLFSSLAGSITLAGAVVLDAKVSTTKHGMALDSFWIQNSLNLPYSDSFDLKKLFNFINNAIKDSSWVFKEYENKKINISPIKNYLEIETNISFNNNISNVYSVIEITTNDKRGLLYEITETLSVLGLQISSSHISTYGKRAVDVFYVKDLFGLKVTNKRKIDYIIRELKRRIDKEKNNSSSLKSKIIAA
ncbi:MAG: [protein-PII] uridylyltransferase [Rhodospirillaceae bacterium]|nr:[protein-PII] uridylyltransferase [Rhodospirillaceae bacterium]